MLPDFRVVGAPSIYVVGKVSRARQYQDWPELVRHFHIIGVYSIRNDLTDIQSLIAELNRHLTAYAKNRQKDEFVAIEDTLVDIFDEGATATGAKTFSQEAGQLLYNGLDKDLIPDFMDVIEELKIYKRTQGKPEQTTTRRSRGRRQQVIQQQQQQQFQWGQQQPQQQQQQLQWGKEQQQWTKPTKPTETKPPVTYRRAEIVSPTQRLEERRRTMAEEYRRRYPGYRGTATRTTRRETSTRPSFAPRRETTRTTRTTTTRTTTPTRTTPTRTTTTRRTTEPRSGRLRVVNFVAGSINYLKRMAGEAVPVSMLQQLAAEMRTNPSYRGRLENGVYTGTSLGTLVYFCEGGRCGLFRAKR